MASRTFLYGQKRSYILINYCPNIWSYITETPPTCQSGLSQRRKPSTEIKNFLTLVKTFPQMLFMSFKFHKFHLLSTPIILKIRVLKLDSFILLSCNPSV